MNTFQVTEYDNSVVVEWSGLTNDAGATLSCEFLEPLGVAFEGDFAGAEVIMEGQLGTKFMPLISANSECVEPMKRTCLNVRPRLINVSAKTSVSVFLLCTSIPKRRLGR